MDILKKHGKPDYSTDDMQKLFQSLEESGFVVDASEEVSIKTKNITGNEVYYGLSILMDGAVPEGKRLKQSIEQINVGKISGPVGTNATVSPKVEKLTCEKLKLKVAPVSNQIIQRDRYADFISTLAICGGSLEKFATEIRS